jgi:MFS family permease
LKQLLPDLAPARENPAFRRLLAGGLLSTLGSSMTSFAVVLQLWDLSGSSLDVGLLGLTFIPVLIIGLLGGSIADAVDRRKLALAATACLMAVSAAFAVQAYAQFRQLWLLYALAMVQAIVQAINAPSRGTFVPRLVPPGQLNAAITLSTLSGRIVMLFGPALAGVITGAFGLRTCYAVDTISFVASLYATARLPPMRPQPAPAASKPAAGKPGTGKPAASKPAASKPAAKPGTGKPAAKPGTGKPSAGKPGTARPSLHATAEGLRFIRRRPVLVAAFLTDLDAMLLGLPVAIFPALNAAHFGGRPQTLGLLNAAVGVGGLLSAALSGPAARVSRQGRGMLAGTMIWGLAIACFGLTRSLLLALVMLAVAGAADTLTVTFRAFMVRTVTPDEFRGRVSSVEYIIGTGGGPLGNVETGTVASLTTPAFSAISGGIGCFAIAVLIAVLFPAFTRYRAGSPDTSSAPVPAPDSSDSPSPAVDAGQP